MLEILQGRRALILRIDGYLHRRYGGVEQFKAVLYLKDGTRLHVNEVWIDGVLKKYAYYHLSPTGDVLRGWDNAPHHPEVSTFPHHCHHAGQVAPSDIRSLSDVLDFLESRQRDAGL